MTDELKKKITAHHAEEMADITAYENLAKEARTAGCHETAGIIEDIVNDEKSHAKILEHILEMNEH